MIDLSLVWSDKKNIEVFSQLELLFKVSLRRNMISIDLLLLRNLRSSDKKIMVR